MILETNINNVDVVLTGKWEEVAHFYNSFCKSMAAAKVLTKKVSIVKANPHTVFVNGVELSLNDEGVVKKEGTDYLIWNDGNSFFLCAETEKISPTNQVFNKEAAITRGDIVGGFHYGQCGEDFKAINNIGKKHAKKLAGIKANTIWDQYHRPACDPKGMAYVKALDLWVDMYLVSDKYEEVGTSAAGYNILAGYEHYGRKLPKDKTECKWQDFKEIGDKFGKRMLTEKEFQVAMYGVKENHSAGDLDNGITKHIPDFMSKYGIEQATGCQWIWSSEQYGDNIERKKIFGGGRDYTVESGSRSSAWINTVWNTHWHIGSRYACNPLHPVDMSESECGDENVNEAKE